ncbi:MAG: hypothetical protein JXR63_07920 [Spirochaetales bacterium]|nr:hypothetical protein [Spirochaetales bacterium]
MKKMFDEIDDFLEDKYGDSFPLHPNRAKRGKTSNKESDGLFNVGVSFSAGYGSKYGRGYVVDIKLSTLSNVDQQLKEEITRETISLIGEKLKVYFPNRNLDVVKDRHVYKIVGDFALGETY